MLVALFSLLPSARLDLLAFALRDGCCCHDNERPHDANCPCKVCTHKRHVGSDVRVITTCAGVFDTAIGASPVDPVSPPRLSAASAAVVQVRVEAPVRQGAPEPPSEVPTPPPLRQS